MLLPDEKILRALINLEGENNENWSTFVDWIYNSYNTEAIYTNEIDDIAKVPISQGAVRQLRQLLSIIKNSKEQLQRLQDSIKQANTV